MKNDTTFARMRSGDHLGDAKMSKRAPRSVEFNFLVVVMDRNGFRRVKEEGQIYKRLPQIFLFFLTDLVMIFQSLVILLPRFLDFRQGIDAHVADQVRLHARIYNCTTQLQFSTIRVLILSLAIKLKFFLQIWLFRDVDSVVSKVAKKIGTLRRAGNSLTQAARRQYYLSVIQSDLQYGTNAYWTTLTNARQNRLIRSSKRALRAVINAPTTTPTKTTLSLF